MWSYIGPAIRTTLVFTVLTGGIYPLAVTGATWALFPAQAHGSLVVRDGKVVGSTLIAQNFTRPEYFHPRPSAASYDASASTGSNWGPTNQKLADRVKASLAQYRQENPRTPGPSPPTPSRRLRAGSIPRSARRTPTSRLTASPVRERSTPRRCARVVARDDRGTLARVHRRAACERAAVEPRAR